MKVSIVTPRDIRYSYKATEWHVYEYAKYLQEHGVDTELLVSDTGKKYPLIKNYKKISERYKKIPHRTIKCRETVLPFRWHHFYCSGLPKNSLVYFYYGIYQYLLNVMTKPRGQKYIVGCGAMELKSGHLIEGHRILDKITGLVVKYTILWKGRDARNVYFHAINKAQVAYLIAHGIKKEKIIHVPIMLDTTKYSISRNRSGKLRVVHLGGAGKGSGTVANIIKALIEKREMSKFEFFFISEPQPEEIRTYAARYDNIHLLGSITDSKKKTALSYMDVMIVPSNEAFSKTMLEGLASGVYIMGSKRNPGCSDVSDLGIQMTIAETGKAEEYVVLLLKMADAKLRLGSRLNPNKDRYREIIVKNFDQKNVLPKFLDMFKGVMEAE